MDDPAHLRTHQPSVEHSRKDAYLAEQAVIGKMGGADWVPTNTAELDEYVATMRPKLAVNSQTREFIDFLLSAPFGPSLPPATDAALHRFALYAGMSAAPKWARELIGFDRPSPLIRAMIRPYLYFDARMLRWAFGTPRYVEMARARASGAQQLKAAG